MLSAWSGIRKGFIFGLLELIGWLGGLLLAFTIYPYLVIVLEKLKFNPGLWTTAICFLLSLLLVRIALSLLTERILTRIPSSAHTASINKVTGLLPGLVSGLVYSSIIATLLLLLPISEKLTGSTRESKFAGLLSESIEKVESKLAPVLDNVNRSFTRVTVAPGSEKFIKLGFSVENPVRKPDMELRLLKMVNDERKKRGLEPLVNDPEIAEVAIKHSIDMFRRGYFSHINPDGDSPFDRIKAGKVSFLAAGENLALAQTLQQAHTGLMNSPGHKANILHLSFGRLGIGIVDGGIYGLMVTQNFRN